MALLTAGAATAYAHDTTGLSTLEQTIIGDDQDRVGDPSTPDFSFLELGPGERYAVREDLARARPGRANRRRSLLYASQITDFQLSDEESPARVEFLDPTPGVEDFQSAHRPQEALVAHQVELTVRQLNRFVRSPVPQGSGERARMVNSVMTGDLADNQHLNETEWVLDLLEGGELDPNSGSTDPADYDDEPSCPPDGPARDALIDEAPNYTGVQDYDDYDPLPPSNDFYDPEDVRGMFATRGFPTYDNLLDEAQEPFEARGLKVPSYVAFGNHDGLAQGNEDATAAFEAIGTGCSKPFPPFTFPGDINLGDGSLFDDIIGSPSFDAQSLPVPPDEDRQYVDKRQFKDVFAGGGQADDHGFAFVDEDEVGASDGAASYYSFVPETGPGAVRYIVLDTLSEGGVVAVSSRGNIDDPQWSWLQQELRRAERRDELVMVWAHHGIDSLNADAPDEAATPCTGATDEHGHDRNPGCDRDPRNSQPLHFGEDLVRLFHRFPNVITLIAGHSHNNRVQGYEDADGSGDFWEIKSPAIVDWPPQHRLIEVMNNRDGTLSIFGTILDHDGPSRAREGGDASTFSLAQLASLGRTIAYNDPQEGPDGSPGQPIDRNVELLLQDPRVQERDRGPRDDPQPPEEPPPGSGAPNGPVDGGGEGGTAGGGAVGGGTGDGGGTGGAEAVSVGAQAGVAGGDGSLPFTGLAVGVLALVGAVLGVAGLAIRQRAGS